MTTTTTNAGLQSKDLQMKFDELSEVARELRSQRFSLINLALELAAGDMWDEERIADIVTQKELVLFKIHNGKDLNSNDKTYIKKHLS